MLIKRRPVSWVRPLPWPRLTMSNIYKVARGTATGRLVGEPLPLADNATYGAYSSHGWDYHKVYDTRS